MKKKKIIVLVFLLLIIIAALVIGYLYFLTDSFKTNKELFFKYLSNTQIEDSELNDIYKKIFEREMSSNYSAKGNIICSTASNVNDTNVAEIQQLFNIKYNRLQNKKLEQNYADLTLNANNEDLITIRYLRDNKTFGIKIENVLKKYLALENNNLKEFYSKLGISDLENAPDFIPFTSIKEVYQLDEKQLNTLKSTYGNILLNNLTQKNFSKNKNSDKTTTIKLSLTEKEFANILKQELETLKNDNNTLNLIINKANMAGYSLKIEEVTEYIQKQIEEINNNSDITDEHFLNISITEKNEKIIKFDIVMYGDKTILKDEESNGTKEENMLSVDLTQNNKKVILIKDGDNTSKYDISYGYESNKIWGNMDITSVNNQTNINKDIGKVKYQIAQNENTILQDATISIYSEESNKTIQININDSKELKQDVQIEKLTNQNSEILNNKSKEELEKLIKAIGERINYVYGNKINGLFYQDDIISKAESAKTNYKDLELQEQF